MGAPRFAATDAPEWVQCHIAPNAAPPDARTAVPEPNSGFRVGRDCRRRKKRSSGLLAPEAFRGILVVRESRTEIRVKCG